MCVCACAKKARERERDMRDMRDTKKGDLCNKKNMPCIVLPPRSMRLGIKILRPYHQADMVHLLSSQGCWVKCWSNR